MSAAPTTPGRRGPSFRSGLGRVRFAKYEGLGNDFILIEGGVSLSNDQVRRLCDRHFGIGADGVLLVERGDPPSMIVRNADGTRPEMCGNGLRCVVAYLVHGGGAAPTSVATDAGALGCRVVEADADCAQVAVTMGRAHASAPEWIDSPAGRVRFVPVRLGNPHAVTFDDVPSAGMDGLASVVGAAPPFRGGTNVEFARWRDGGFDLVVIERGVGRTLACGTGACATVAAACLEGRCDYDTPIPVRLPGGTLEVVVSRGGEIEMRGPARRVFEGEVEP